MKKMILKSTGESVHLVEDFKDYSDLIKTVETFMNVKTPASEELLQDHWSNRDERHIIIYNWKTNTDAFPKSKFATIEELTDNEI
jgi:hypothetical protein